MTGLASDIRPHSQCKAREFSKEIMYTRFRDRQAKKTAKGNSAKHKPVLKSINNSSQLERQAESQRKSRKWNKDAPAKSLWPRMYIRADTSSHIYSDINERRPRKTIQRHKTKVLFQSRSTENRKRNMKWNKDKKFATRHGYDRRSWAGSRRTVDYLYQ